MMGFILHIHTSLMQLAYTSHIALLISGLPLVDGVTDLRSLERRAIFRTVLHKTESGLSSGGLITPPVKALYFRTSQLHAAYRLFSLILNLLLIQRGGGLAVFRFAPCKVFIGYQHFMLDSDECTLIIITLIWGS